MKLCGYVIVWNEIDILPHNLPFMVQQLNKVIVLDGGPLGTSTDGTWEWLKQNFSNNDKVHLETGTFGTHTREKNWNRVMRNIPFQLLDAGLWKDKIDWVLSFDADEFYPEIMLNELKREANNARPDVVMIRYPYHQFYGDFKHKYAGYDISPKYLHNFVRYRNGLRYHRNNLWLYDSEGKCLEDYPVNRVIWRHDLHMFHYSHAQDVDKMARREWRYAMRGDFGKESQQNIEKDWTQHRYVDHRNVNGKGIIAFNGQHPQHALPWITDQMKKRNLR